MVRGWRHHLLVQIKRLDGFARSAPARLSGHCRFDPYVGETHSLWQAPAPGLNLLTFGLVFLVFSIFTGGRFAPSWGIGLVALYTTSELVDVFFPASPLAVKTWPIPLTGLAWLSVW
jgi:hypothetical protein